MTAIRRRSGRGAAQDGREEVRRGVFVRRTRHRPREQFGGKRRNRSTRRGALRALSGAARLPGGPKAISTFLVRARMVLVHNVVAAATSWRVCSPIN